MALSTPTQVTVLDDFDPSLSMPTTYSVYENRAASVSITINSGRPVANAITAAIYGSREDAESETDPIATIPITLTGTLPTVSASTGNLSADFTAPTIATSDRRDSYFLRVNLSVTGQTIATRNVSVHAMTEVLVINSIAATLSAPAIYNVYGNQNVNLQFTFNPGSPTATAIRMSWHSSLANAATDTDELTTNVPTVTLSHPSFSDLDAEATVSDQTGTLNFMTSTVESEMTLYGRIEIEQDGSVVAFDTFRVIIAVSTSSSISVPNLIGVEGETITATITYESGVPSADSFGHSFHASQTDATSGENERTTNVPTAVTFNPTTPASGSSLQTATLSLQLPYVAQDRTIYIRVEILQGTRTWYETASILIQNRFQSSITMPSQIEVSETESVDAVGSYIVGIPSATAFDYEVYATEENRNNQEHELIGDAQPLTIVLSPASPDVTGDRSASKTLTATVTAPSVEQDTTYYLNWEIVQEAIPADPE